MRFVLALTMAAATSTVASRAQAPSQAAFDVVAAENGGHVEWVTEQFRNGGEGTAMNLIASTRHPGWSGSQGAVDEIVFSFYGRQTALIVSVEVNPFTSIANDRPKDVEIWTARDNNKTGFVKAAAVTLKNEDRLQSIPIAPVETRFVKLRILTTYPPPEVQEPGGYSTGASRVRILEGTRPGYTSILARNPALAALARGEMPLLPPVAGAPPPPDQPLACAVPRAEKPKPSNSPQSKRVLVVTNYPQEAYKAIFWQATEADTPDADAIVIPGATFEWMAPSVVAPAHLVGDQIDTVVFAQACQINTELSPAFKQALFVWVGAGHKVLIQDSDWCAGNDTPEYPFMPFPFATSNPGALGAKGEAGVLENSTLVSEAPESPAFVDTTAWKTGLNDLGDSNVIVKYDAHWCGAMWATNKLQKNGMTLAYAHLGRGLIIYDGFDHDQFKNPYYRKVASQEMLQPFDPDYLPCSQPLGDFIITTKPEQKTQHMAAGKTYTYPVSVLGNFGYTGVVNLEAAVVPPDPNVSIRLDARTVDLTKVDEGSATLTVTTSANASLTSKAVAVRGRDAKGNSNVLCLELPERTTGSISVVSLLQPEKKPTKNLEIILDASGSMKLPLGARTRWATAQAVLKDVVSKLPSDFNVGLRAYGHTLPSTNPGTCKDTALIVPVGELKASDFLASAGKLAPRGETPLVYSILQTPADLEPLGGGTVILITDGEESCKGDFAAAAQTLKESGLNLTLNIVGFTLKNAPAQAQLSGLAESTGGHYFGAQNGDALSRAVLLAALDRLPYRILDAAGKEVAKGDAGVGRGHELPPGNYRVVITAADQDTTTPVAVVVGQDVQLKASVKADKLVVER